MFAVVGAIWLFLPFLCHSDLFSSVSRLKPLLHIETTILGKLRSFIEDERSRLDYLERYLLNIEAVNRQMLANVSLTRSSDDNLALSSQDAFNLILKLHECDGFPVGLDFQGAALALLRLQDTYRLRVPDLSRGVLKYRSSISGEMVSSSSLPLSASDCYEMGKFSYDQGDYYHAVGWLEEAAAKTWPLQPHAEAKFMEVPYWKRDITTILDYLAFALYQQGNVAYALYATDLWLSVDPESPEKDRALNNRAQFVVLLQNLTAQLSGPHDTPQEFEHPRLDLVALDSRFMFDEELKVAVPLTKISMMPSTEQLKRFAENSHGRSSSIRTFEGHGATDIDGDLASLLSDLTEVNICPPVSVRLQTTNNNTCLANPFLRNESRASNSKMLPTVSLAANETSSTSSRSTAWRNTPLYELTEFRGSEIYDRYESLCRGDVVHPLDSIARLSRPGSLFCTHSTNGGHPLLILQPARVEVVSRSPLVLVFRAAITPSMMDRVREIAMPMSNANRLFMLCASYGIYLSMKCAWLADGLGDSILQTTRLSEALTGMDTTSAEELQVLNYGIGGHYEPHFDFATKWEERAFPEWRGNRLGTLIYYLSTVEGGGRTVFPSAGLAVAARRGDAIFWPNLLTNEEGDVFTQHAGCPVVLGDKWIAVKWFHARGNEWRFPCPASYSDGKGGRRRQRRFRSSDFLSKRRRSFRSHHTKSGGEGRLSNT